MGRRRFRGTDGLCIFFVGCCCCCVSEDVDIVLVANASPTRSSSSSSPIMYLRLLRLLLLLGLDRLLRLGSGGEGLRHELRDAVEDRARVVQEVGGDEGVVEHLLRNDTAQHLRLVVVLLARQRVQLPHDLVLRVHLQVVLGGLLRVAGDAVRLHELLHARLLVVRDDGRRRRQTLADLDRQHLVVEDTLQVLDELRALGLRQLLLHQVLHLLLLVVRALRLTRVRRLGGDELVLLVHVQVRHHDVVRRVRQEDDLDALLLEGLVVRGRKARVAVRRLQEVDVALVLRHAADVVVQGHGLLAVVARAAVEAQQLGQVGLVDGVRADTLLDELAELLEELRVGLRVLHRLLVEPLQDLLRDDRAQLPHESGVLRRLTRQVERDVLGVNDTLHKPQVLGHQSAALALDQHLAAVQRQTRLHALHVHALRVRLRHVHQRVDVQRAVDRVVQPEARRVVRVRNELVELLVLLLVHLVLRLHPQRLHRVDARVVEVDLVGDEVRVLLHDPLDDGLRAERDLGLAHVAHNLRALLHTLALRDRERARTVALPHVAGGAVLRRPRVHLDVLGDHEGRVETHTELSDDAVRRAVLLRKLLHKRLRAGVADGTDVRHKLVLRHADTGVGDHELARVGVDVDLDRRGSVALLGGPVVGVGDLEVATLLQRVGGVRDQLTHVDLLVCVDGADHDVEQLLRLCLELVVLLLAHRRLHRGRLRLLDHLLVHQVVRRVVLSLRRREAHRPQRHRRESGGGGGGRDGVGLAPAGSGQTGRNAPPGNTPHGRPHCGGLL
eukprot:Rhum_TRINITY_DN14583_c20_g1::Rhum_TRINITY_DN14583_c20_g1_i1::g.101355::m.101355